MLEGQQVDACKGCYSLEAQLNVSYRLFSNNEWSALIGPFEAMLDASLKNKYKVLPMPISFHLIPGTLCNLKCRMCNTLFSSQIQRDRIHTQWCPPKRFLEPEVIQWQKGNLTIGPEPIVGVATSGFYDPEIHDNRMLRWTQGDTSLSFKVPQKLALQRVKIKIWEHHPPKYRFFKKLLLRLQRKNFKGHHLKVLINDHKIYNDELESGAWEREFDLSGELYSDRVTVHLLSDTFRVPQDSRLLGVALERVEVECVETDKKQQSQKITDSAHSLPDNPWYAQTNWILNALLKKPESIRELYFSGGEPMLQKQVEEIIDFCIAQEIAANVCLKFNTNCTVLHDRILKKLGKFQKLFMGLSIDGFGPYWEYIRYPGKWDQVDRNISKYTKLANAQVVMVPVLQVYNALNFVELLKYSDQMGTDCWVYPLTNPVFLSVAVLPPEARLLTGKRLREYAENGCRPENSNSAMKMADYVESVNDNCTVESLRNLMLFTNDLDATRNQSFQKIHGELLKLIEETGFRWTDERRFF
jgi:glutamate-1-semialdehyde 2,1-aminomutase